MLYFILKYLLGPIILLVTRPIVYGKENLRVKGKAIFICNHRSMWDPLIIALCTPRTVHFMAKKEIFEKPIGRMFFKGLNAIPVNRKNVDMQSLKNALKVLNSGKVFGIFPEGKRAVTDYIDEFEKGTAFFAIRSGAPVIPIYIHPDSQRRGRPVLMAGKAINIGEIAANTSKSALMEVVTNELSDAVAALGNELEEIYCS